MSSRKAPPNRVWTGTPSALPARSQSAISTPLTAQAIGPVWVAVGLICGSKGGRPPYSMARTNGRIESGSRPSSHSRQ